jgi:hypothetical protein
MIGTYTNAAQEALLQIYLAGELAIFGPAKKPCKQL